MNKSLNNTEKYKEAEEKIMKAFEVELQKVRDVALLTGSKTICGVVLKKARDTSKNAAQRLVDIINFCERSLGVAEKNEVNN